MVMSDKEIVEVIHTNIHALRLLAGYKPSEFEKKVSNLILERFNSTCADCKNILEMRMKGDVQYSNKGFLDKVMGR